MRRTLLTLLAVALVCLPGNAVASAGSCADPQNDTFDQADRTYGTAGPLDIKTVAHSDTSDRVRYTFTTYGNFNVSDVDAIQWFLELDGDDSDIEGFVGVEQDGSGGLRGEVDRVRPGPQIDKVGDATVTHTNGTPTLEVDFARQALHDAGLTGTTYGYGVIASRNGSRYEFDAAPEDDFCVHAMSPSGSTTESRGEVNDSTVRRGQRVTITGKGFAANQNLQMTFTSTPVSLGTTRSDGSGAFSAAVTIPSSATPGAHRITVTGPGAQGGNHTVFMDVTVLASSLPATGGSPPRDDHRIALVLVFAGLVGAGLGAGTAQRRRIA